jgi:GNAT superfamily N-acetyltransferase
MHSLACCKITIVAISTVLEERIANISDLHFICGCILYGARKDHYSIDADNKAVVNCMRKEMLSVIDNQELLDGRHAQATIFSVDNRRIAVVIISEASAGDSIYEIYAMSVISCYQGKGFGAQILDVVLSRFLYLDICARCLPASYKMSRLLERRGFEYHSMDKGFKVLLRTAVADYQLAGPAYERFSGVEL